MSKYLVLIGSSGAGKTTVIEHLLKKPLFELSVSYTTRKPRPTEKHGINYFFITEQDFDTKVKENFFLEYTEFNGCKYGTPCQTEDPDKILIFDIEIDGFKFFQANAPRSFFCLLKITRAAMESRLRRRMTSCLEDETLFDESDFLRRMKTFDLYSEIEKDFSFDWIIDNSKTIEKTFNQIDEMADTVIEHFKNLIN